MLGGSTTGNPIAWVADLDETNKVTNLPCPSSYEWMKEYVSSADSGRTENGLMSVNYVAEKVKIKLSWKNVSGEDASTILSAFSRWSSGSSQDKAYLKVRFLDALSNSYKTKTFYVGERTSPCYNTRLGVWEDVSFNIIER